ncbi:hypothetical protein EMGBS10_12160 [Opitutia bacterium]|nr:hypothetical protein EMGBS10_12160 [Opitutae bacterium]
MGLPVPPVLIIAFNRPDSARRVFSAVRAAKPSKLFLACDAARPGKAGEAERVAEVRALVEAVDWPCEVRTKFPESNLGSGLGVSSAITWFLGEAGEGVILEDDCLPTPAFFRFAATMLERHRDDPRIGLIAGSNMAPLVDLPASHGFSRVTSCWGWATWKRTWDRFTFIPEPVRDDEPWTRRLHPNAVDFLRRKFQAIAAGKVRTVWDYQFMVQALRADQLTVVPGRNLILNIGFDGTGTHFGKGGRPWAAPAFAYDPADDWSDQPPVVADERYDRHYLTSGHRGSSKLMRQVLKWRILWARRRRPIDAVLFD